MSYIFETFTQARADISRKYGGTGLGLTICKELVHLLDGQIALKSEKNVGTTFEITLAKNKESLDIEKIYNLSKNAKTNQIH